VNPRTIPFEIPERLIILDGICNFCSASANFIIKRDPTATFSFATVQSKTGNHLLTKLGLNPDDPNTFVLIKNGEVFCKSGAALEIAKDLTGAWPVVSFLRIVPAFIRDFIYDLIARHRYKIMGKRQTCMIPTDDVKARFID